MYVWWSLNGEINLYWGLHGGAMSWQSSNGEIGLYWGLHGGAMSW